MKKPIGTVKTVEKVPDIMAVNSEEFIAGCNERGCVAPRYQKTANGCNPVPPFTLEGLAHLASLLSDMNTASGGVQRPHLTPEEPKRWAMGFLSEFNPHGHCKVKNAEFFLEAFARQVVAGESEFEP